MVLIVLHGLPATGKTTIARQLGVCLGIPFISTGSSFDIACRKLEKNLISNTSCMLEVNWWGPHLTRKRFKQLLEKYNPTVVQLFCVCSEAERQRRLFRSDDGVRGRNSVSKPLKLGGKTFKIDTTHGVVVEEKVFSEIFRLVHL